MKLLIYTIVYNNKKNIINLIKNFENLKINIDFLIINNSPIKVNINGIRKKIKIFNNIRNNYYVGAFNQAIKIKPGKPYSSSGIQETYKRLFSFQIIRTVNISFDTLNARPPTPDSSFLNCKIRMQKSELNSFTVAAEGTNSSGDLGMRGNIILLNMNWQKNRERL